MIGTDFYFKKKISSEDKQKVIDNINNDNLVVARDLLAEMTNRIHIGKLSDGWQFLWNPNRFQYFEPNINSLKQWLQSGIIEDEYGKEFTFYEFLN